MFPLVVHQPAPGQQCSHSGGVCPQIQRRQCGAYVGAVEEMMCVWMLQRGHSGDGCVLASTLCKYDFEEGRFDLFLRLGKAMRRVRRGSISSELLVCLWRCAQYLVIASCG